MNGTEEKKLRVDDQLFRRFSWMDEFAWAILLRKPEILRELTKLPYLRSVPVFAKQVRMNDVYKRSVDLLEKVPDMPFGSMTEEKLKEATEIFEETCRDLGCFEGVAARYKEIASLVPESFEKAEDTFVYDIEKIKKDDYDRLDMLLGGFGKFLDRYVRVINQYRKVNEKHWKRRQEGMKPEDARDFLQTIYAAGRRIRGDFNYKASKKRVKAAARRKYIDLVVEELGEFEEYFSVMNEETKRESMDYLLDLAEGFDSIPKTDEEVTRGPAGMPVELRPILVRLFGEMERYKGDPQAYKNALRESSIAMDSIRNTNWFDYGGN